MHTTSTAVNAKVNPAIEFNASKKDKGEGYALARDLFDALDDMQEQIELETLRATYTPRSRACLSDEAYY